MNKRVRSVHLARNDEVGRSQFMITWEVDGRRELYDEIVKYAGKMVDFNIGFTGKIIGTEKGGHVFVEPDIWPSVKMKEHKKQASRKQINTLRMIERFLYIADNHVRPQSEFDLYYIHEGLVLEHSREVDIPGTDQKEIMRTSDPRMDTLTLGSIIAGALDDLATRELPEDVLERLAADDIKGLYEEFYGWLDSDEGLAFSDSKKYSNWEEYRADHQWCEASFTTVTDETEDPIVRCHIVTRGASAEGIEEWWNWIAMKQSIHQLQHDIGWADFLKGFPHLTGKVERARKLLKKKEIEQSFPEVKTDDLDLF